MTHTREITRSRAPQRADARDWFWRLFLHALTGLGAVAAHYLVMLFGMEAGLRALAATSIGFLVGAAVRFGLSYTTVFVPSSSALDAAPKFVVVVALQAILNVSLLAGFMASGVTTWPAQILTTGVLTLGTYLAYRGWVFR